MEPPTPRESLSALVERVVQYGYRKLRPQHLVLEDYCTTLEGRLLCAEYSYGCLSQALKSSHELSDQLLDIALLKESESCIFFLSGSLDVLGHILNICCALGLLEEPLGRNSPRAASISTVVQSLRTSEKWKDSCPAEYVGDEWDQSWRRQLTEWRNRVTHRRIFHFVIEKDVTGRATAYLTYPDPSDPLMSLATTGSLEVPGCFQPILEGVQRFVPEVLSRLLVQVDDA